jgi:hypothetical protein
MGSVVWDILADSRGQGTDFGTMHRRTQRQLIVCCHLHQASFLP